MVNALAVAVWAIVVLLALVAAGAKLPSLAAQALIALGGLGTAIAFVAGAATATAWISVGLACVAAILASVGARSLIYDNPGLLSVQQPVRELSAGVLGLELSLLAAVIGLCIGMALA
jgi:hypothetical protein